MNTLLRFKKEGGKAPTFTFRRSDGSSTWSKLRTLPIEHDLAHYVVERELRIRQGFYGLLDQGYTAADFDRPRAERPVALLAVNLPIESIQTELIVGMLQAELISGPTPDFLTVLQASITDRGLPFPASLTSDRLAKIRTAFADVIHQWNTLNPGDSLELSLQID